MRRGGGGLGGQGGCLLTARQSTVRTPIAVPPEREKKREMVKEVRIWPNKKDTFLSTTVLITTLLLAGIITNLCS